MELLGVESEVWVYDEESEVRISGGRVGDRVGRDAGMGTVEIWEEEVGELRLYSVEGVDRWV